VHGGLRSTTPARPRRGGRRDRRPTPAARRGTRSTPPWGPGRGSRPRPGRGSPEDFFWTARRGRGWGGGRPGGRGWDWRGGRWQGREGGGTGGEAPTGRGCRRPATATPTAAARAAR